MDLDKFNDICAALPAATHVVQWGDADVWKVGGKVFAIAGWWEDEQVTGITFKTTAEEYEFLVQMPGLRPAPYLSPRSPTWVQQFGVPGLDDTQLGEHLEDSHRIIASGLTKKKRSELGLSV